MPYHECRLDAGEHRFVPLLQQMLQYIEQQYQTVQTATFEQLLFEAKIILTELLTNAIKHSGGYDTVFRIEVEANSITFVKTDPGPPLNLLQHPQLGHFGETVCIASDVMHDLYGTLTAPCNITFSCTEHELIFPPDGTELPEHFGLLIIAKAADEFRYEYKQGVNIFAVKKLVANIS